MQYDADTFMMAGGLQVKLDAFRFPRMLLSCSLYSVRVRGSTSPIYLTNPVHGRKAGAEGLDDRARVREGRRPSRLFLSYS